MLLLIYSARQKLLNGIKRNWIDQREEIDINKVILCVEIMFFYNIANILEKKRMVN